MNNYAYDLKREFKIFGIKTSKVEIQDLLIAWLMLSFAFLILFSNMSMNLVSVAIVGVLSLASVALGFIVHELAHKLVAMRFGYPAEFRKDFKMLLISIGMSFFGIIFAAPGAVYILGNVSKKHNGIISFAGPLSNFIVALLLFPLFMIFGMTVGAVGGLGIALGFIIKINLLLAVFNMIPILNFDGAKIWRWNKAAYLGLVIPAALLLVFMW